MDQSLEKLLRENLELAQENNKILRKMQRGARWGRFFKFLFWLVIIGASMGTYYYLQPFLNGLLETYESVVSGVGKIEQIGNSTPTLPGGFDINSILKNLPKQ